MDRSRARVEVEAAIERIRSMAGVAQKSLLTTIVISVAGALAAWGVLFGVRLGNGTTWVLSGLVVLAVLLLPAAALVWLARQLHHLAELPDHLSEVIARVISNETLEELRERLTDLSARTGLSLVLGIGSMIRWLRSATPLPEAVATTERLARMVALLPLTVGIGVPGTIGVIILVPVFAMASLLLLVIS